MGLNSYLECSKRNRLKRINLGKCDKCSKPRGDNSNTCDYHRGYNNGRLIFQKRLNSLTFKLKELESKIKDLIYTEGAK